jgi:outer membrane immunogenic protein
MNNVLITGLILGALMAPAAAADMSFKARQIPSTPAWNGCYLGGSVGGIWKANDPTNIGFVDGGSGITAAVAAGALPTTFNPSKPSWLTGSQSGCNYQSSNWVFGLETDLSTTRLDADQVLVTNVPPFFPLSTSVTQELNWIGTTRGRLGVAWDNVLFYGTVGAAYANVNYSYTQTNVPSGGGVAVFATDSATRLGWTAGGGLEVLFGRWSVKGEYLFYDLGSHSLTVLCDTCTGPAPTTFTANFRDRAASGVLA